MNKTENSIRIENRTAAPERLPLDAGDNPPGQFCLANESRFDAAFLSQPLTTYATGWKDTQGLEDLLDFIAPPVQVGCRFEFRKAANSEFFLSETDDLRALGSEFKRVEYTGETVLEKTLNKGLTMRVDLDLVGQMPNWREAYTGRLLQRLLRNEASRAIGELLSSASNSNKLWDGTAGKDPDQDLLSDLINAADASGVRPNRILFGEVAWNKRLLAHRAQDTAGGYASSGWKPEELAGFLGVDGVRVSRARWQSSASAKSRLTGDVVLEFFALSDPGLDDPSHAKRFWSPVAGGARFGVYEQPVGSKFVDLTVEHYCKTVITTTLGLRKLSIA